MNFLHKELDVGSGDVIEVALDHPANVLLMDSTNFSQYKQGQSYRYHGGYVKFSPFRITVPSSGHWHLVIDLGGYGGTVRATAKILSGVVT